MEKHVNLLGIFFIASGILGLIGASVVFVIFIGSGVFVGAESGDEEIMYLLGLFGIILTSIILITSIPEIIAGIGLMKLKPWSRILGIIVAVLNLPAFPIGTALGIYAIWVLFQDEAIKLFKVGAPGQ